LAGGEETKESLWMGDKGLPILLLIFGIVALDQFTKYCIQQTMTVNMSIPVIDSVFHLTYILNPGAAFGILENQRWFFLSTAALLFFAAAVFWRRLAEETLPARLGVGMLLGGAIGNVIDRARSGYVVDFFDFRIWPVFNVADIFIVAGVGLMMCRLLFNKRKE